MLQLNQSHEHGRRINQVELYDLSCTENQRSSNIEGNRRSLLRPLQFQFINILFQPLPSNSLLSDPLFSMPSNNAFVGLKGLFFPSTVKILAHLIKNIISSQKILFSSKLARPDSSISKYSFFVLFRQKGNVPISQRVLLAHISALFRHLNDVRRSVCLDLDTTPKLSTNNVCWNHLRILTKT